jgi:hypothetical protein
MPIEQRVRQLLEVARAKARRNLKVAILAALAAPAPADDRAQITQYEQQLSDAITNGAPAAWDKYLDPDVIYVSTFLPASGDSADCGESMEFALLPP